MLFDRNGELIYQISDAQRSYQQLNQHIEKIDYASYVFQKRKSNYIFWFFRRVIANLADSAHENDRRYAVVCRNIRSYSIQVTQSYSRSTKRVPSKEEITRICEEQNARLTSTPTQEVKSTIRQNAKAIYFVKQESSMDGEDEISFIELS